MTCQESHGKLCKNLSNKLFGFPHTPHLSHKKIRYVSFQQSGILSYKFYVGLFKLSTTLTVSYHWLENRDKNFCEAKMHHIYHKTLLSIEDQVFTPYLLSGYIKNEVPLSWKRTKCIMVFFIFNKYITKNLTSSFTVITF